MCEQYNSPYTSATGDKYLFNNDKNIEFVKMFRDWYQKSYVTTQNLYNAYTSGLFTATTGQKSYMCIGSSAGASHQIPEKDADGNYPFEVGIATIPQVDASNPKVISQGPSLCIFKKDNAQEVVASWLFVKFLTTKVEFQAEFSMVSGYVPVIKSVGENETYKKFINDANGYGNLPALSAKICLEQEKAYYTSPAFNGSSVARDEVGKLMTTCLAGDDGGNTDTFIKNAFQDAIDECIYKG
jgi:multiple sugar transport system substrate-binding protein